VPPRAVDLVLDALATRLTEGYAAAAPLLTKAFDAILALVPGTDDVGQVLWLMGNRAGGIIASELLDFEAASALGNRQVQLARDTGALVQLQFALNYGAQNEVLARDLAAAQAAIDEDHLIAEVSGNPPVAYTGMVLAGFRGQEAPATELIAATSDAASARGQGRVVAFANYARAVLYNGLGRHDAARDAARVVFEGDFVGYRVLAAIELAEAASRTGGSALLADTLAWSAERAAPHPPTPRSASKPACAPCPPRATPPTSTTARPSTTSPAHPCASTSPAPTCCTANGSAARATASTPARTCAPPTNPLPMGIEAFADRARRELLATGETVRKRTPEPTDDLTPQELQIARLAREGFSNPEIGTRLFLSPRTIEWHLRKVFTKLAITSRRQLRTVPPFR
jgi:DNA-binding CsgD family transcriptional regulator